MKAIQAYKTRDHETHNSHQAAEKHCLDKAVLKLAALLREAGIDGAHGYATKIIDKAVTNGDNLGAAYYDLFEVVAWLKDSHMVEGD